MGSRETRSSGGQRRGELRPWREETVLVEMCGYLG